MADIQTTFRNYLKNMNRFDSFEEYIESLESAQRVAKKLQQRRRRCDELMLELAKTAQEHRTFCNKNGFKHIKLVTVNGIHRA